jgi:hypothetical protein
MLSKILKGYPAHLCSFDPWTATHVPELEALIATILPPEAYTNINQGGPAYRDDSPGTVKFNTWTTGGGLDGRARRAKAAVQKKRPKNARKTGGGPKKADRPPPPPPPPPNQLSEGARVNLFYGDNLESSVQRFRRLL